MSGIAFKYIWLGLCMFLVSFSVAYGAYPTVLRMARVWRFYDNPDARKLQRNPVPVLGGLCVYYAICVSLFVFLGFSYHIKIIYMILAMGFLLVVGMIDDKWMLGVWLRFLVETLAIFLVVKLNNNYINTLGGLWGVGHLSNWIALPLSVFAGVGLVNAINLIDGVDGYSSSYVFLSCCSFAVIFYVSEIPALAILCMICSGSLLPFILHNVFGKKTKMFIGDSGTLMMGMMLTIFCFSILRDGSYCYVILQDKLGVGIIPLTLAILSICIFDTLRVMLKRMLNGKSPFHPDKTHLHHLFIDAGFSHLGTTLSLLLLNMMSVAGCLISCALGASIEVQLYVVILLSLLNTVGLYELMTALSKSDGRLYRWFCRAGAGTHWENGRFWQWMQRFVDDGLFEEGRKENE